MRARSRSAAESTMNSLRSTGTGTALSSVVLFADADLSWSVEDLGRFLSLVDEAHRAALTVFCWTLPRAR